MFPDNFNRISGPDANTCAVCHHLPRLGGGGDNAVNVFTDAERLPFVNFDGGEGDGFQEQTLRSVGNERNTAGIFGIGFVELLAREMTVELQGIVDGATEESKSAGVPVTRDLVAKGVSFGRVTARPNGTVDTSEVEGVDDDFIIKPIQSKGHIVSLREFVVKAMNSHFGIQAVERFGADADGDGVLNELTQGDVTASGRLHGYAAAAGQGDAVSSRGHRGGREGRNALQRDRMRGLPYSGAAAGDPDLHRAQSVQPDGQASAIRGHAAVRR